MKLLDRNLFLPGEPAFQQHIEGKGGRAVADYLPLVAAMLMGWLVLCVPLFIYCALQRPA